ncbi:MAG: hypothetical protein A2W90_16975 [Bacteroidetes bacterium GWF2_42_66]|nr:MAG: hypothetical protein A2W92_15760 [Bacteroidetes bacterium GWA2_42_15]OFX97774.1 MAG: hypothetical protein A2W89_07060 [Bacteroidetes bacterium GWE2_42_39]OFY45487.1 MAG: hypothetical protein A2W90_16975 [Bacteroidetes bacterium GWF2_42_66]HBL73780.1 hypothetical protein [Prolixibacteraceae bacterium]HCU63758.1 hypothetical protein [Prolixibacteraceae bacterium]
MARGVKTGGRQKGTSNKLSGTVKEMITQFVENEVQNLPGLLIQLEPKEKVDFIIKLLPFIIAKPIPKEEQTESFEERRKRFIQQIYKVK